MVSLTEEFDHCWAIFHLHFPHLQKPTLHIRTLHGAWGVCSGQTDITLNPILENTGTDFVRHTIFHEMCHLIYHNHKREFYDLLKQFDPMQIAESRNKLKRLEKLKRMMDDISTL